MPITPVNWLPLQKWVQYDGTNSADILASLPDAHDDADTYPDVAPVIDSETGGVLSIAWHTQWMGDASLTLNEDDWYSLPVTPQNGQVGLSTTQMEQQRVRLSDLT